VRGRDRRSFWFTASRLPVEDFVPQWITGLISDVPEAFASDAERVARFEREAKTLASLNHPNIAIIHGLEKSQGTYALVMELVEGEDLSQRIQRGPIPIDEASPIAKQIALRSTISNVVRVGRIQREPNAADQPLDGPVDPKDCPPASIVREVMVTLVTSADVDSG
jgi:hypothetical protein